MIFAVSDQKTKRIVELLIKKVRPFCGVLEVVVKDRGNKRFMSSDFRCLIKLVIIKLNMTTYHLEGIDIVE